MKKINTIFYLLSIAVFNQAVAMEKNNQCFEGQLEIKGVKIHYWEYNYSLKKYTQTSKSNNTVQIIEASRLYSFLCCCKKNQKKCYSGRIEYEISQNNNKVTIQNLYTEYYTDEYTGLKNKLLDIVIKKSKNKKVEAIIPAWQKNAFVKKGFKINDTIIINNKQTPKFSQEWEEDKYYDWIEKHPNEDPLIGMSYNKDN